MDPIPRGTGARKRRTASRRAPSLTEAFDPGKNSLAFLRLVLVGLVLFDHAFILGGFNHGLDPMWAWSRDQDSFGGMAVAGFFVISGFLVTRSFVTSRHTLSYVWKRFLRIFPGFWVCLVVTAFVFAPIAFYHEHGHLAGLLGAYANSPSRYITGNFWLQMKQYSIDGLLAHTPYPSAFDGSLWTLIYEFTCYIAIALLGALGVVRHARFVVLGVAVVLWFTQLVEALDPGAPGRIVPLLHDPQLARLAFLFATGSVFFLYRDSIRISPWLAASATVAFAISFQINGLYSGLGLLAFAYICIWLAVRLPLTRVDRYGDFSYGLYIYAFPCEQLACDFGVQHWGLLAYVIVTSTSGIVLAMASWHAIERPALRLKGIQVPEAVRQKWEERQPRWWPPRWQISPSPDAPASADPQAFGGRTE